MTFVVLFIIGVLVLYAAVCLVAGAICGSSAYKNDRVYYSVSSAACYTRLKDYLTLHPEAAHRLVCINNLKDEALSESLKRDAEMYGFSIISQ